MLKSKALSIIAITSILIPLSACSNQDNSQQVLFSTKKEAQKAAKIFGCTGAHKMGDKWMPCKKHGEHQKHNSHNGHGEHHNH